MRAAGWAWVVGATLLALPASSRAQAPALPPSAAGPSGNLGSDAAAPPQSEQGAGAPAPAATAATAPPESGAASAHATPAPRHDDPLFEPFAPKLSLSGYMRMRGQAMYRLWLGRAPALAGPDPFAHYIPLERLNSPGGGCVEGCDRDWLTQADLRLRAEPQLELSREVRVHATFDILDNVSAGDRSAPSYAGPEPALGAFGSTRSAPSSAESVKARRAWAEFNKGSVFRLAFGRMASHFGLGIVDNAGNGLDDDFSSEVDRVSLRASISQFYGFAAYDLAAAGYLDPASPSGVGLERSNTDDVDQLVFRLGSELSRGDRERALEQAVPVLDFGVQAIHRRQELVTFQTPGLGAPQQVKVNAKSWTPDLWLRVLHGGFRLELEAAAVLGSIENAATSYTRSDYEIRSLGAALETELRLADDRLGLYFDAGFATGDNDVLGLSADADLVTQSGQRISTFRFHPAYRVDLILWRSLMRQVSGASYVKPGVSYDLIRSDFGQRLELRGDAVYSVASSPAQTWGKDRDLGLELDFSLGWRSDDGPNLDDGLYLIGQYGILFPMQGLGYPEGDPERPSGFEQRHAQLMRVLLGVVF